MPGFLSAYSGITRVEVGDPEGKYWIDIRQHLSHGQQEAGERALANVVINEKGREVKPDTVKYRQTLLLASIADWNLADEDDGPIWPLNLQSVKRLPGVVFDQLWELIDESNGARTKAESRQFPAGGVGGDPDGGTGAAESVDVLDEAAVLAAPGDDEG
jgi:hypothetical protein